MSLLEVETAFYHKEEMHNLSCDKATILLIFNKKSHLMYPVHVLCNELENILCTRTCLFIITKQLSYMID